jgi:NAD-dependent dihydropyrimidine dehydrogenase PreA subunit
LATEYGKLIDSGCHINDCHYNPEGNYDALSMVNLGRKLLEYAGINPQRLRIEWVSAGEGIRFANIMNEFGRQIEVLGPLGSSESLDRSEIEARLEKIIKLVPYLKIVLREKLSLHNPDDAAYTKLYTSEEITSLIDTVPAYYIDPEKCRACSICLRRCPVEAIDGGKNLVHIIDQEKCIKCGTCFEACPPKFGAIRKLAAPEPVPASLPESAREVVRTAKDK